jgi:hypothetical protein
MVVTVQYKTQGSVAVTFTASDWKKENDSFHFSMGRHHGKGPKPVVSVYMPMNGGGYEEIMCHVYTLESGEVILGAAFSFDGEIRIS